MKIIDKINCGLNNERVIYIVEVKHNVFIDVMYFTEDNSFYVMKLTNGGYTYDKNDCPVDCDVDKYKVINFVKEQIKL